MVIEIAKKGRLFCTTTKQHQEKLNISGNT